METPKKRLKKNYWLWGRLAEMVQYLIPIGYIVFEYDVFIFKEKKSLTGGVFLIVFILYFFLKNKIKMFIKDYNNNLGEVAQKAKWGLLFFTLGLLVILAEFWVRGTVYFMFTLGLANFLSLPLYAVYYTRKNEYDRLKQKMKDNKDSEKVKGLSL